MNDQMNTSEDSLLNEQNKDNNKINAKPISDFIKDIDFEEVINELTKLDKDFAEDSDKEENQFPVDVFPSPFKELIIECKKALNFPIDYMGSAILVAVSTAIGRSAKLKVKSGWHEFASFYLAIVGNAGANKSHPLDLAFKPFQKIDQAELKKFKLQCEEMEAFEALPKKQQAKLSKPMLPRLLKTILHNFTPEILLKRLADHERGCAVVSDELATFLEGMNNYSKGDQTSSYLSIWNNKPTSVDRVKLIAPFIIPEPFLNIIGGLQPRVLPKLFPVSKSDVGFLQRFLFADPSHTEKKPINDIEIDETLIQDYSNWIANYIQNNPIDLDTETKLSNSKIYDWNIESKKYFYEWHEKYIKLVNENADSLKGEIISKFDIHFVRISLVLQIMKDFTVNQVSIEAVQGAALLCRYFHRNAMKVLNRLQKCDLSHTLPINKQNLYKALPDKFSTAEAIVIGSKVENGDGKYFDEKAVDRFLKNEDLFVNLKHGYWSKKSKL